MTNRSKGIGDRAERAATCALMTLAPDLAGCEKPMRMLGAGRKEDIGDVKFNDLFVIQVKSALAKNLNTNMSKYVRDAALGAHAQLDHARAQGYPARFALGLVPVPYARADKVSWVASTLIADWPTWDHLPHLDVVPSYRSFAEARAYVVTDTGALPRAERIVSYERTGHESLYVAPLEAWLAAARFSMLVTTAGAR